MRAGIGLVGILLGIGLLVWVFSETELPKVKEGEKVKQQARQMAGYSQDETPAMDSFLTDPMMKGSKLAALQVTSVTPGGAMDTYYGLKTGDEIVAVGDEPIDLLSNNDDQLAKAMVVQRGYQAKLPLTVRRSGQRLVLPLPAAAAAAAATANPAPSDASAPQQQQQPAQPQPAPQPQKPRGLEGQLQDIEKAAGGAGREQ
jgi:hypothetical protein